MMKKILATTLALGLITSFSTSSALASVQPETYSEQEAWGQESNETPSSAEFVSNYSFALDGYIWDIDDDDCFKIKGNGSTAYLTLDASQDLMMKIYDNNRNLITTVDSQSGGTAETWSGYIPSSTTYYVKIYPYASGWDQFKAEFPYLLTFEQ